MSEANNAPAIPPTGSVTFLFTDIVGSTEMWEQHGDAFLPVLQAHNAILSEAISSHNGYLIKTEGDAYKVAFHDPADAVRCAIVAQAGLQRYPWPHDVGEVSVRMAVHFGRPFMQAGDYYGSPVNRTARILSATHGGQILLSEDILNLVENRLDGNTRFHDLGYHRLKDLDEAIRLFQVSHASLDRTVFPPPCTLNGHAHNLPIQRTSFVGREREIEHIAALLSSGETPFLALTGPQGIGKTRLSLQIAADRVEWFPDGVWYVQLSGQCDAESAAAATAAAIGIDISPGTSAIDAVRDWVSGRDCLLVLDDCGHVPDVSKFIRELLTGSHTLRCLATCRQSAGNSEAAEIQVPELTLPAEDAGPGELLKSESGQLFVERAAAANPRLTLNDQRAGTIARLLHKTGGVAAVIEKAAEVIREVAPSEVLEALSRGIAHSAGEASQVATEHGKQIVEWLTRSPGLAALFQRIGVAAGDQRDLALAEHSCREALTIYRRVNDRSGMASTLHALGRIALSSERPQQALVLLSAAQQLMVELSLPQASEIEAELAEIRRHAGEPTHPEITVEAALNLVLGTN